MPDIRPVILAGGSGSRLWPLSRRDAPKSLHRLAGTATMLQQTAARFHGRAGFSRPLVICGAAHRPVVLDQLRQDGLAPAGVILEPGSRNTAAAAALAAVHAVKTAPGQLLLILPTDHRVQDSDALAEAVTCGAAAAEAGFIVVFGAPPDRAETGYGYIRPGPPVAGAPGCRTVLQFVEKPTVAAARRYVESEDYLWNVGIFLFRAQTWLDELDHLAPEIARACRDGMRQARDEQGCLHPAAAPFLAAPAMAIDTAVMEKTRRAAVVATRPGWADIGTWRMVRDISCRDRHGNAASGDVITDDVRNSLIRADSRLVVAIGVNDVAIVETADAVLVADMAGVDRVKAVVDRLNAAGRREAASHNRTLMPWGHSEELAAGPGYRIRRVTVVPGGRLTLLSRHRQHLLVVRGTARLSPGRNADPSAFRTAAASEHLEVPAGRTWHLENLEARPLEVIATALGDTPGDDGAGMPDGSERPTQA